MPGGGEDQNLLWTKQIQEKSESIDAREETVDKTRIEALISAPFRLDKMVVTRRRSCVDDGVRCRM